MTIIRQTNFDRHWWYRQIMTDCENTDIDKTKIMLKQIEILQTLIRQSCK